MQYNHILDNANPPLTDLFFSLVLLRLKIDCEAISGPGVQQGATLMIGQPQESQGVIKEGLVAPVGPSQPQTLDTTALPSGNFGSRAIPSSQEILNLIASKYLNNLNPSTPEDFNGFIRYMKEVREVILVDCKPGSLIITVECGSLDILDGLWQDYSSGNLGRVVQECLVTEDILKELGLTEVKLTATIDEKDYIDCHKYLARGRYDVYMYDPSVLRYNHEFKTFQMD